MQYLILIYSDEKADANVSKEEQEAWMGEYNAYSAALAQSGLMKGGEALHPTSSATTVRVKDGKTVTTHGPFAETKELLAGFWIWKVDSLDEAIEWAKRCPNPMSEDSELEIRQVFEAEDFGAEFTPELREQEERLRAKVAEQQG